VDAPALRSYIGGMGRLICRKSMTRMAFLLAVALPMWAGDAIAEDYSIGTIEIAAPWTRATPKGANIAAAYAAQ
jgi:copper(I)-binding protein